MFSCLQYSYNSHLFHRKSTLFCDFFHSFGTYEKHLILNNTLFMKIFNLKFTLLLSILFCNLFDNTSKCRNWALEAAKKF